MAEYFGKEVVKFEGEDVQNNYQYQFIKCTDTTFVVDGKFKTVMLEGCTNVKIIVTSVISNIEIINCKKVSITVKEQ